MGDVGELLAEDKAFLEPYLPPPPPPLHGSHADAPHKSTASDLPFVTLTYASSLDSMIALAVGARTTLSGAQSKRMTHYLRLRHDAILVGVGTAAVDDPSLNCRYPGAGFAEQPRPVVVDPRGRWACGGAKVLALAAEGKGKGPWVVSRPGGKPDQRLLDVGGQCVEVAAMTAAEGPDGSPSSIHDGPLAWREILRALKRQGVDSVMIEGGARVINSLLGMPDLVDSVILTVAPTWLGCGGVEVQPAARTVHGERVNSAWLAGTSWRQFGDDAVLCGRLSSKKS